MAGLFPARKPSPMTVSDDRESFDVLELRDRLDRGVALVDAALGAGSTSTAELKNWLLDVRNVLRPPGGSSG